MYKNHSSNRVKRVAGRIIKGLKKIIVRVKRGYTVFEMLFTWIQISNSMVELPQPSYIYIYGILTDLVIYMGIDDMIFGRVYYCTYI